MNKTDYIKFHREMVAKMTEITKAKNHDYTGASTDPFANFRICEKTNICSTEQGFLVRMSDKMARINSFVQQGTLQVKDESVQDTLMDLANYCILFAGYIQSERELTNDSEKLTKVTERGIANDSEKSLDNKSIPLYRSDSNYVGGHGES